MRVGVLISTLGGSPLQVGLERGLRELDHFVEDYQPGQTYDLIIVHNQTAHCVDYDYLQFPPPNIPIAFIDSAEYGWVTRMPDKIAQYWNAFAPGSMTHDTKNSWQQKRLRQFLEGRSFPYFLREYSKHFTFPPAYHPIDYPLYHFSVCDKKPNREEYLARDLDLFVSWGASHPWRLPITEALRTAHVKAEIHVLEQDGWARMPQAEYFARTEAARCTVSFDGYGSGSFRMTEALVRTLLLQGPLSIETRAPLIDGYTCIEYDVRGHGQDFLGTDIAGKLRDALADKERAYQIYERGYYHCTEHLTEKATAQYLLDVVHAHDWNKPTQLEIP